MKNLVLFLAFIFGAIFTNAQDTIYLFQSEVDKGTMITIVIPDSINGLSVKNDIFNERASIEQNYRAYFLNENVTLSNFYYPSYDWMKRLIKISKKELVKTGDRNAIFELEEVKYEGYAYELFFIFVSSFLLMTLIQKSVITKKLKQIMSLILYLLISIFLLLSFPNKIFVITGFFFICPFILLLFSYIFNGKNLAKGRNTFIGINIVISVIIILFFSPLASICYANLAGLILALPTFFFWKFILPKDDRYVENKAIIN